MYVCSNIKSLRIKNTCDKDQSFSSFLASRYVKKALKKCLYCLTITMQHFLLDMLSLFYQQPVLYLNESILMVSHQKFRGIHWPAHRLIMININGSKIATVIILFNPFFEVSLVQFMQIFWPGEMPCALNFLYSSSVNPLTTNVPII